MRKIYASKGLIIALLLSISVFALLACTGPTGPQGSKGSTGPQGPSGSSGAAGLQGSAGDRGSQGTQGAPGSPGLTGPQGVRGLQGSAGEAGQDAVSPQARLVVDKSMLTVDEPLEVTGSGFLGNESVVLVLVVSNSIQPVIGTGSANSGGGFAVDIASIDELIPAGVYTLLARGSEGSMASAPVEISISPVPMTSPSSSLAASPVETGGETNIWGAGFMPGEAVSVYAVAALDGGDWLLVGGEANATGAFQLVVRIRLSDGVYSLKATGDMGSEASAPLLVASK